MATLPTYTTVETCATALDVRATAHLAPTLARLTQVASRTIDRATRRTFYPTTATRSWRVPRRARTLLLPDDLLAATTVTFDGTAVTDYTLEPRFYGPPYDRFDLWDATSFAGPSTVVEVAGRWGFCEHTEPAGTLATSPDASTTAVTVSDASLVGVGDLILCGTEQMVVTAKGLTTTTTTLSGNPTASQADTTIGVASGAAVHAGELVTVDSETMEVLSVSGNNLAVRRAVDGSTLAAHVSTTVVYAPRALTVERGAVGTTAASHSTSAALTRNVPEALIVEWCLAEVEVLLGQEKAGWSMTVGEGEAAMEATGQQLGKLRAQALGLYRRRKYGAV